MKGDALAQIERELHDCADELRAGRDVAPARRARLEGAIAAVIAANDVDVDAVMRQLRALLPAGCAIVIEPDIGAVSLQLWQRRAPVYPSTAD